MTCESLCNSCEWMRLVVSGRGARYLLCRHGLRNHAFAKYPRQPVLECSGYDQAGEHLPHRPDDLPGSPDAVDPADG